jgi:hypothetical protein
MGLIHPRPDDRASRRHLRSAHRATEKWMPGSSPGIGAHSSAAPQRQKHLRVLIATPYGRYGRGGIDRMNDMAIDAISASPELDVTATRLVTRGAGSIMFAPFVLAAALVRLWRAARRQEVDVLHVCLSLKGSAYRKCAVAALARHCGVPYVVHLHGGGFEFFWLTAPARLRRAVDRLFVDSGKIVVLGHYWVGVLRGWIPQSDGKVAVLPMRRRLQQVRMSRRATAACA